MNEKESGFSTPENWLEAAKHYKRKGDFISALTAVEQACVRLPAQDTQALAAAFSLKGLVLEKLKRYQESAQALRKAARFSPTNATIAANLISVHFLRGDYQAAISAAGTALERFPDQISLWAARAAAYVMLRDIDKALDDFSIVTGRLQPEFLQLPPADQAQIYNNYANTLVYAERYVEAGTHLQKACALCPDISEYHEQAVRALRFGRNFEAAIKIAEQAKPLLEHSDALRLSLAFLYLTLEDYDRGLPLYENRMTSEAVNSPPGGALPFKANEDYVLLQQCPELNLMQHKDAPEKQKKTLLKKSRILVTTEQGYGDMIMFARFLSMLCQQAKSVTFYQTRPELTLQTLWIEAPDNLNIVSAPAPLPAFDYWICEASLPCFYQASVRDLPPPVRLQAPQPDIIRWKDWLDDHCQTQPDWPRIGVVGHWRHNDKRFQKQMGLIALEPLAAKPCWFIALEPELLPEDQAFIDQGHFKNLLRPPAAYRDFADSAALISNLDRVITVDTVFIHLAASLGVPVDALVPFAADWRWGLAEQGGGPWYQKGVTIYRQKTAGDWSTCIDQVAKTL